jgi:hypothetical protein
LPSRSIRIASIIMKANWLAMRRCCAFVSAPPSAAPASRTLGVAQPAQHVIQPNGNSLPLIFASASFTSGQGQHEGHRAPVDLGDHVQFFVDDRRNFLPA